MTGFDSYLVETEEDRENFLRAVKIDVLDLKIKMMKEVPSSGEVSMFILMRRM